MAAGDTSKGTWDVFFFTLANRKAGESSVFKSWKGYHLTTGFRGGKRIPWDSGRSVLVHEMQELVTVMAGPRQNCAFLGLVGFHCWDCSSTDRVTPLQGPTLLQTPSIATPYAPGKLMKSRGKCLFGMISLLNTGDESQQVHKCL